MTQIRIKLTADDFRTLVTGGEVVLDDTGRMHVAASIDHSVHIILEDMGWVAMAAIIEEVWDVWPIEPKERKP
ncbi:hypothetical protein LCGC14_0353370 [marine sediment metagenome]|uniref:Uncharacterized protein n=1 Tax=marine sediment metagenome TaxID=412755 RepID=A0A0F9TA38_9ZZZZ